MREKASPGLFSGCVGRVSFLFEHYPDYPVLSMDRTYGSQLGFCWASLSWSLKKNFHFYLCVYVCWGAMPWYALLEPEDNKESVLSRDRTHTFRFCGKCLCLLNHLTSQSWFFGRTDWTCLTFFFWGVGGDWNERLQASSGVPQR